MSVTREPPPPIGRHAELALADLDPNPANRKLARDEEIAALAQSIKEVGLLHPILVRPHPDKPDRYRIVAGERRFRALRRLRVETANCVVLDTESDSEDVERLGVVENHHRRPLSPLEEAAAVRRLLDLGLEPEAVARSLGRNRPWVARRSSLTDLSDAWREALSDSENGLTVWPASHLELVSRFPHEAQDRMLAELGRAMNPALPSLADLRGFTGGFERTLGSAPWRLDDETLAPEAGACSTCTRRSSCNPDLFHEELPKRTPLNREDRCLDTVCWADKARLHLIRREEALRRAHPGLVLYDVDGTATHRASGGTRALRSWEAAVGRKSDAGAVPAMIVSGPGRGRLRWVIPVGAEPRASRNGNGNGNGWTPGQSYAHPMTNGQAPHAGANGHDGDANGATPETLAESVARRRVPYDKRRRQHVVDAVRAILHRLAATDDRRATGRLEGGAILVGTNPIGRTLALLFMLLGSDGWRRDPRERLPELPDAIAWDALGDDPDPDDPSGANPRGDDPGESGSDSGEEQNDDANRDDSAIREDGESNPDDRTTTLGVMCAFQALLAVCWNLQRAAVATLAARCFVSSYDRDNDAQYDNAAMACELLGLDLAAFRDRAATAIPYAKAWRDHVHDDWRRGGGNEPVATDATDTTDEPDPYEGEADPPDLDDWHEDPDPDNHDPHDTPAHAAFAVSDDEDA